MLIRMSWVVEFGLSPNWKRHYGVANIKFNRKYYSTGTRPVIWNVRYMNYECDVYMRAIQRSGKF